MALNIKDKSSKKGGKRFEVPEDTYVALPQSIISMGPQFETDWKTGDIELYKDGNPIIKNKVWITFELPDLQVEGEEGEESFPAFIGKEFTFSDHEKAVLMHLITAIDADITDVSDIIGKPLFLTVGATRTGRPKIVSFSRLPSAMDVSDKKLHKAGFVFDEEDYTPDQLEDIPKFLLEAIKNPADAKDYFESQKNKKEDTSEEDSEESAY